MRIGASTDDAEFDPVGFVSDDGAYVVVVKTSQGGSFSINGLPPGTYRITYATSSNLDGLLPDVVVKGNEPLTAVVPGDGVMTIHTRRPGDVNDDGHFDSTDLVLVFGAGTYENGVVGGSTFDEGDWNGDGEFNSSDLILAFNAGTYVSTPPRASIADAAVRTSTPASIAAAVDWVFSNNDQTRKGSAFVA